MIIVYPHVSEESSKNRPVHSMSKLRS